MLYPGDFKNGSPEELYNCRCTMGTVEPPEILQGEEPRVTYQEWYKTKEGQEALEKARLERNKKAAKRRKAKKKQQNNSQNGLKSGENGGIIREEGSKPITQITDANIQRVPKVEIVGYSNEQCEMIHNQHKELLNYSRDINGCNEVAFVFYNNLASRKECTGNDDRLEFKGELYGKDLFIMHNHPRNGSFSITDLMFFKDHDNIKTFSIVKNNGNVEYISRTSEFDVDVFKIEYMRLYKKIVINGTKKEKDLFVKTFLTKTKSGVIWSERK